MTRFIGAVIFVLAIIVMLLSTISMPALAVEFHVSPTGDDSNAGTQAAPFATLTRARDAIREWKAGAPLDQPLRVVIMSFSVKRWSSCCGVSPMLRKKTASGTRSPGRN